MAIVSPAAGGVHGLAVVSEYDVFELVRLLDHGGGEAAGRAGRIDGKQQPPLEALDGDPGMLALKRDHGPSHGGDFSKKAGQGRHGKQGLGNTT